MRDLAVQPVSLISQWFIKPGSENEAISALEALAVAVQVGEPDTLTYLVHVPFNADARLQSLPPAIPFSVLFFESYRSPDAFLQHLNGQAFTDFVTQNGALFLNANGKPFTTVQFLGRQAGFVRPESTGAQVVTTPGNRHPSVMFEVIAKDQAKAQAFYGAVFGWTYQAGSSDFAYVQFPTAVTSLLGGIGQAQPDTPGFEPGRNFYLLVDKVEDAIARATAAGGSVYMPPTSADGYRFAMIEDPEGNPIGLIEPFNGNAPSPTRAEEETP